jgi:ABC-2 type transport system permease protein
MTSTLPLPYRAYTAEIKYELLKRLRMRSVALLTIGFPVMFYLFFGVANRAAHIGNVNAAKYILVSYACFGLLGAALSAFGVSLAIERGEGWLELKQASPMPPFAHLLARLVNCVLFSVIILAALVTLGITLADVHFTALELAKLTGVLLAGVIPFAALGMVIGLTAKSNSAVGVVNMIYLPLSYCSGLWMPIQFLPTPIQKIAPFLPTYHFAQLAQGTIHAAQSGSTFVHWQALIGFTFICLGFARYFLSHPRT